MTFWDLGVILLRAVESLPCRQLNVLWVMVGTQIEHSVDELDSLHFQNLQVCREKDLKKKRFRQ